MVWLADAVPLLSSLCLCWAIGDDSNKVNAIGFENPQEQGPKTTGSVVTEAILVNFRWYATKQILGVGPSLISSVDTWLLEDGHL